MTVSLECGMWCQIARSFLDRDVVENCTMVPARGCAVCDHVAYAELVIRDYERGKIFVGAIT